MKFTKEQKQYIEKIHKQAWLKGQIALAEDLRDFGSKAVAEDKGTWVFTSLIKSFNNIIKHKREQLKKLKDTKGEQYE